MTAAKPTTLVIGAVEVLSYEDKKGTRCERAARVRLSTLDDAGEVSIRHFLTHNIDAGATLRTDGWRGYSDAALVGYPHRVRVVRTPERAHRVAPHIHRVLSHLKTWLNGTHHGVEPKYLQSYWDEVVFRFNRRHTPMAAFQTLLGISTQKAPLPLPELVNRSQPEKHLMRFSPERVDRTTMSSVMPPMISSMKPGTLFQRESSCQTSNG